MIEVSHSIMAFRTSRNRPRVRSVNGRVRTKSTGFTTVFTTPSTTAAKIAGIQPSTLNPGMIFDSPTIATAITAKYIR